MSRFATIIFTVLLAACATRAQPDPGAESGNSEQAARHGEKVRAKLVKAGQSPKFQAAVKKLGQMTDTQPKKLETQADGEDTGGVQFEVSRIKAQELLADAQRKAFGSQGAYLFRYQDSHGIEIGGQGANDLIALLPTTDQFEVVAAVETEGPNSKVYNADLLKWLRELHKSQPFQITDATSDSVAAKFTTPVKEPRALAARVLKFCPDFDQGDGPEATTTKIATQIQKGALKLWWD